MAGSFRKFTKQFIITCNVCVSVCMLLLYILPYTNQNFSWFINVFALLLPFLMVLQIMFLIFWLMVKRKLLWIPVVTIVLCWNLLGAMFALHPVVTKHTATGQQLRVATWNAHLFNFFENNGHKPKSGDLITLYYK